MTLSELPVRRPVFIASVALVTLLMGVLSLSRMPVDQFPDVTIPYMVVTVVYPGAAPREMETLVAEPLEEQVRTIAGVRNVHSLSMESVTVCWAEFAMETDPLYAEQQFRDKVARARTRMPRDIEEPLIRRHSFSDRPILRLVLSGETDPVTLRETAERLVKPEFERVGHVSLVRVSGGGRREIQVLLDRDAIDRYEIPVSEVAAALERGGRNIPLGKRADAADPRREWSYRAVGEYRSLADIRATVVRFVGNDVPVRVADIARVDDAHRDITSLAWFDGRPAVAVDIYRQSGANTVRVAEECRRRIPAVQALLERGLPDARLRLETVYDASKSVRDNINDVVQTILLAVLLTVLVVFLFLGNLRSTLITAAAIPNALLGAFIFASASGFSVNLLTLLGLSLGVGLLIDDSIVVRENIFHHMELGKDRFRAASEGVAEVTMAVIATTLTLLAVFAPIAYIRGITGRFLREFGLTVCYIMTISTLDALFVGPMLSAWWYSDRPGRPGLLGRLFDATFGRLSRGFIALQGRLADAYGRAVRHAIRLRWAVILLALLLFAGSLLLLPGIPKTFLPPIETGEILLSFETPPGSSLRSTADLGLELDRLARSDPRVLHTSLLVGDEEGEATEGSLLIQLRKGRDGRYPVAEFKRDLRRAVGDERAAAYRVRITDYNILFGGQRPFAVHLVSTDPEALDRASRDLLELLRTQPRLRDPVISQRPGKPEVRVVLDPFRAARYGVPPLLAAAELRAQIQGLTPAKLRQDGQEWDIRVRLQDRDRDLVRQFGRTRVPNINYRLVPLPAFARLERAEGPSSIHRLNGRRLVSVTADLADGVGLGDMIAWMRKEVEARRLLPPSVELVLEGEARQFEEMTANMALAFGMALAFIYLVLASLYNSFATPWGLLLPLPIAVSGALFALALGRQSLNIYSVIALIMLLGIETKNAILIVEQATRLREGGMPLRDALVEAGRRRLRPILMTSFTTVAGALPIVLGFGETARQRAGMGWVIVGGVLTSTLVSIFVIPAVISLFDRKTEGTERGNMEKGTAPTGRSPSLPLP